MASTEHEPTETAPEAAPVPIADPDIRSLVDPDWKPEEPAPDEPPATEPAEETPPAAASPDPDEDEYSERVQKRINKLTAERREAERKAERLERELEEQRIRDEQQRRAPDPQATQADPNAPDPDKFEDYDKYIAALAEYHADKRWQQKQQQEAAIRHRQAVDSRLAAGQKRLEEQGVKDFDRIHRTPREGGPHITPPMFDACNESEHTAEIAYYLATHVELSDTIARMNPVTQIKEIGRIEAAIQSGTIKFVAPTRSNAPPPITPKVGGNETGTPTNPDKLPIKEWMKREREGTLKY